MRKMMIAGAMSAALTGIAGLGHNLSPVTISTTDINVRTQAVLPRRIVDENRRNQKLKQKLRKAKRRHYFQNTTRAQRKTRKFGTAYRPGKLFKGHRV